MGGRHTLGCCFTGRMTASLTPAGSRNSVLIKFFCCPSNCLQDAMKESVEWFVDNYNKPGVVRGAKAT